MKNLKRKHTYTITLEEYEYGVVKVTRTNDGFNILELLGLISIADTEIKKQLEEITKPNITERVVNTKEKE